MIHCTEIRVKETRDKMEVKIEVLICAVVLVFILLLVLYVLLAEFRTHYEDNEATTAEEVIKRYLKDDMFKD